MQEVSEYEACAKRLKALADPERLRLVDALRSGEKNVSDLAAELGTEIVNVSHHLGVLKQARLVQVERRGRFMIYSLAPEVRASHADTGCKIDLGCCSLEIAEDLKKQP
jgi:ArsR family transcriptional regulator, nickel/cobalt-responsive transcriptional repressor